MVKHKVTLYAKTISKQLKLDVAKYNTQYKPIVVKKLDASHDRFLIIDEVEVYHVGASLKDLGKNGLYFLGWMLRVWGYWRGCKCRVG